MGCQHVGSERNHWWRRTKPIIIIMEGASMLQQVCLQLQAWTSHASRPQVIL
jgi:hypothetical protein